MISKLPFTLGFIAQLTQSTIYSTLKWTEVRANFPCFLPQHLQKYTQTFDRNDSGWFEEYHQSTNTCKLKKLERFKILTFIRNSHRTIFWRWKRIFRINIITTICPKVLAIYCSIFTRSPRLSVHVTALWCVWVVLLLSISSYPKYLILIEIYWNVAHMHSCSIKIFDKFLINIYWLSVCGLLSKNYFYRPHMKPAGK